LGIITSSPALCGQKSITLTAPSGFSHYSWSGPAKGIVSKTDTTQNIQIDSAGTYSVIVTPVTGGTCADTLSITISKAIGAPALPSFTADTVCVGQPTSFTNTSTPLSGKFYWDFYDQGIFQDSTVNPTWTYNNEGVYSVHLFQISGGCGVDTVLKILVDSTPITSFRANGGCLGSPTFFTNATTGASSYSWNFGDPASGAANTSTLVTPSHTYSKAGKFTATLIATNAGTACIDTFKHAISITAIIPTVSISGKDSICSGSSTILKATGTNIIIYSWSTIPTVTIDSALVAPLVTTMYTVTVTHGSCNITDSFKVTVTSTVASFVASGGCVGQTTNFKNTSSGASTYTWNFGDPASGAANASTLANPNHTFNTVGNYSVSLVVKSAGGACTDSINNLISITVPPTVSVTGTDSICAGTNTILTASGTNTTSYSWSTSPVQTTQTATVSPVVNTTYTVTAYDNLCSVKDSFQVSMRQGPVDSISGPKSKCNGDTITLTAKGTPGTYVWSNGATTSSITIVVSKDTSYSVAVTNGCTYTANYSVTAIPGTGITACCDTTIAYGGSANVVATGAVSYVWLPSNTVSCSTCANTTASPLGNTTYTVVGRDAHGCRNYDTLTVDIACSDYFVPNVFTPNGDNQNDQFIIQAYGYTSYKIEIYDRWGLLMYTSDTPFAPWDGRTMSGEIVSTGVYYYIIKSVCGTKETDHDGFVQVIK